MRRVVFSIFVLLTVAGCSSFMMGSGGKQAVSSSLVDYLYPNESERVEHSAQIPLLKLPVKVGLAFVPSESSRFKSIHYKQQIELLERVKKDFLRHDFIGHIEIIPANYLTNGGGFDDLDRISRLHDVDVMALVSYDQLRRSMENKASLFYWTIVGMYLIPGNDNRVQTFVDTAVFDIKSRKMLFRAPGISKIEDISTAISVDKTIADSSAKGFNLAFEDMIVNLNSELSRFKTRVKEEKVATIEHRKGYGGSGSLGFLILAGLLFSLFRVRT